ncbi:helix-turn-helix transcriptional regulator [Frankia sp. AgB32]|uniref:helix-turn-helix transcriptional regulator n=1 Tax=Frankia sp. AgB32 TaxID=631119 RepID=UPI002010C34A|nr:helix-turn-helix transcriptional regulator [Frankia sp. AgB32]MCK9895120.1 helix-turn-helix transcriptional regulator [Frankia sp. AgB32]
MTGSATENRSLATPNGDTRTGVGPLLRQWRQRRRLSQLELALRADSSARHLSFVETGRSTPSRAMVLRLAEHLDVPIRDRNTLLVAAGYAPAYPETPLADPAMAAVRDGLVRLLDACAPNPALVLDGQFDVLMTNDPVLALLDGVAPELLRPPINVMRLALHPHGLAPRIVNLPQWRAHLLERMHRNMIPRAPSALRALYEEVAAYPVPDSARDNDQTDNDPTDNDPTTDLSPADPPAPTALALPLHILVHGQLLSFVSTMTTFNTPMDVTVSELALEMFLPADQQTARALPLRVMKHE